MRVVIAEDHLLLRDGPTRLLMSAYGHQVAAAGNGDELLSAIRELLADGAGAVGYLLKDRVLDGGQFTDALTRTAAKLALAATASCSAICPVCRISKQASLMIAKDFPLISGKSFAKRKSFAIKPVTSGRRHAPHGARPSRPPWPP